MEIAVFDTRSYDRKFLSSENEEFGFKLRFLEARLTEDTVELARGCGAICCFVNDRLNAENLERLKILGVQLIALRCAGFNHVDLAAAKALGLTVVRVPEYSPYAVAEHAVALLMTLNRKMHRAYNRVHDMNFSLEGLVGFDLHGKTVGVMGTGRIGEAFARIMNGFGCRVLAYDQFPNQNLLESLGLQYVSAKTLFAESDIISLHIPLTPQTRHIVCEEAFTYMKPTAILINTGRGGLIDTPALIQALKCHKIGGACLDVYEEEEGVFFSDHSETGIEDDTLARLITFPNVVITSHQAFLTKEALTNIARVTLNNIRDFVENRPLPNIVSLKPQ